MIPVEEVFVPQHLIHPAEKACENSSFSQAFSAAVISFAG